MHDEEEFLIPLLEAGARGYVVKSAAGRELLTAVREVASGAVYVRSAAARVLAEGWGRRAQKSDARKQWEQLSEREQAVVRLFAEGYTLAQIGEQLFISPKTVDTYRRRVTEKTGLADRAAYVKFALELGLLSGAGRRLVRRRGRGRPPHCAPSPRAKPTTWAPMRAPCALPSTMSLG
jgi:DNA-binding NarL/FixJ family response regulator